VAWGYARVFLGADNGKNRVNRPVIIPPFPGQMAFFKGLMVILKKPFQTASLNA